MSEQLQTRNKNAKAIAAEAAENGMYSNHITDGRILFLGSPHRSVTEQEVARVLAQTQVAVRSIRQIAGNPFTYVKITLD